MKAARSDRRLAVGVAVEAGVRRVVAALLRSLLHGHERGDNATDACFDSDAYRESSIAARSFHPDCAPLPNGAPRFARFVFWDDVHPTGATHSAIGAALVAEVEADLSL